MLAANASLAYTASRNGFSAKAAASIDHLFKNTKTG
jgi:hypothetical protein